MKNIMTGYYVKGDESYVFNFYTNLSAYEKMVFVNSVVENIIDDTRYDSVIRDLIFDFNIIRIFTDIDTSFININNNDDFINPIILIEEFLDGNNAVDIVKENMEYGLIEELNKAVNLSVEYRTGIHINPINEALTSLINTIENKIKDVDLDSMAKMANVFANMTGEITPESIVNAYISSDTHKKNVSEIENVKKPRNKKKQKKEESSDNINTVASDSKKED